MRQGCETIVFSYPVINANGASEVLFANGLDNNGYITSLNGTLSDPVVSVWGYDAGEDYDNYESNIYIELSIPKSSLNLTYDGTPVQVGCSYDYYFAGYQSMVL